MKLKSGKIILGGCVWVIFALSVASFSVAAQSLSDVQEQVNTTSEVLKKSLHDTYQGTGSAKVSIYTKAASPSESIIDPATEQKTLVKPRGKVLEEKTEEFLANFTFKGDFSRVDCYEITNGQRGARIFNSINTPEQDITYNKNVVILKAPNTSRYYRRIGYDFHPEALISFGKKPLTMLLPRYLKYLKQINFVSTEDRLLRLNGNGEKQDEGAINTVVLTLDPKAMFRPIEYNYVYKNERLGVDFSINYQAEWKLYSTEWYATHIVYEEMDTFKNELPSTCRVEIQILNFDPTTVINDSKFTLDNLHVPSGTIINDSIIGLSYTTP